MFPPKLGKASPKSVEIRRNAGSQRVCMKGFSQFGVSVGDKGHGLSEVVLAQGGLEVREGLVLGLWLAYLPVHEEADSQAAEHTQDPQGIGAANPAAILIE